LVKTSRSLKPRMKLRLAGTANPPEADYRP
jgi:hypothetical protein